MLIRMVTLLPNLIKLTLAETTPKTAHDPEEVDISTATGPPKSTQSPESPSPVEPFGDDPQLAQMFSAMQAQLQGKGASVPEEGQQNPFAMLQSIMRSTTAGGQPPTFQPLEVAEPSLVARLWKPIHVVFTLLFAIYATVFRGYSPLYYDSSIVSLLVTL